MSVEGPVISWVADHRKHHAYSDRFGDPHSPHVDHGGGWRGALRGLGHAHVGWLFDHTQRGSRERFAPDLLADPVVAFVDRMFLLWSLLGLAIPFGLGVLIGGTVSAGLEGMLWGGAVRILVLHHVTYSINSLCHFFGRRRFATEDHSRNLLWLAPFSLGEAWHNNHHAFPTSAFHGMGRRELDISGLVIAALERAGLVWDVQRVGDEPPGGKGALNAPVARGACVIPGRRPRSLVVTVRRSLRASQPRQPPARAECAARRLAVPRRRSSATS